ncbi:two-component regulator propeller domain-containing protein [Massilia sp. TS11]|uniref:two-component regulator propeller domain-containing protein n=1 Tax=Massilia sp. TS11 TaxID=2908003 RepID=UPI001EDAD3BB|nr:two-component regulator propeller domain-containing protein [Massilia sp. TS11]MCG2585538.1 ATP-binding protein [Massilia sp. TS11]
MRVLTACLLALVLALTAPLADAAPARTLRFEQLSVEQGLAQESVLAIAQDADGFMWFGSQAGLSRFDGYKVTVYKSSAQDPKALADNWVRVLHVDRDGRLWIGTDGGLNRYEPATQSFSHFAPRELAKRGSGYRHIRAIIDDGAGGLWIASGDGLQRFDPASGKFTVYHHDPDDPHSLGDDQINALALDKQGRLWIGTASGLDSLAPGAARFEHHNLEGTESRLRSVQALQVASDGALWIGSLGGLEAWRWDRAGRLSRQRLSRAEGLQPGQIITLYEDQDQNLWVGSLTEGLYRWLPQAGRFAQYKHMANDKNSVADNQISALYRDRVGTFWVGTWYAGVSRVDLASGGFARVVRTTDNPRSISDNKVRAIAADSKGMLWLGTNSGLDHYDPASNVSTVYRYPGPASADQTVAAIARDARGRLYVGSKEGLRLFDPASQRFSLVAGLPSDPDAQNIRYLYIDRAGILWVASRGGLHRYDPASAQLTSFRHDANSPSSLADNVVRPILEDSKGRLWVGTFNGLDLLDRASGRFSHYHHDPKDPSSLSHDEVHYLYEDRNGKIWVGTAAGLNRMDQGADGKLRFRRFSIKDGLADDAIAALQEDSLGRLWISTNTGISRFDQALGRWRNFSAGDGTIEGAYFDGAAARASDGSLYFGGFNGMTAFIPESITDNQIAPRAVITDFQVFNKSVGLARPGLLKTAIENASSLTLEATDSVFSLEFSALHYAAPQRNRFAYQLKGFDETWVTTDASKRFATYTNLDPGSYTFMVKAANKDGVWSARAATLEIVIRPPFWKTWWFRLLAASLVLGGVYGGYRMRVLGLRRQKAMLEQQVRERVTEIEQQNRRLELQTSELEKQRAEAVEGRLEAERQKEEVERQKDRVEQAQRNIATLSEIGREMTATLDMETIMMTVYRHVHHLMDARIFGIGIYQPEANCIDFPFSMEQGVRSRPYSRSLDDPNQFAVWCLNQRREIFINDIDAEYHNYIGPEGIETLTMTELVDGSRPQLPASMLYAPLIVKERVMGVLCVQSVEKQAYRRVHMDMLLTLAAHAAIALDNARAYQQLADNEERLLEQEKQIRQRTEELALANTALQENEERLRLAKQRAEDATRQKSEFLANMSHEMRTPLAGVIGMLGFALRDASLAPTTRQQIERGQINAQSLLAIINDLLDFSKIEAGKLSIENIDFSLIQTLENVISLFEEQALSQSLEFIVDLAPDLPQFVVGDPTRLRQVLVNLVGNAFKFTNQGFVKISVTRAPVPTPAGLNQICFAVQDSGIGIRPEALSRLFQKFEQADATTTRRYGGTGLGLAICRQLVELMGGEIQVRSAEGQGSMFSFTLPLPTGVAPPLAGQQPREPHSHRLRVLCAEDFPTNQIIIRMLLEELGHQVDIADNGLLAVQACARTRYDLILMDGRMPEMDGVTATRLIRSGGPSGQPVLDAELMIVALTANASEEDRQRYLAAGMDDFLTKPIDEAALHLILSRAIARQLARGLGLSPMGFVAGRTPSMRELDAMFGVDTAPLAEDSAAEQERSAALRARMRTAFSADLPARLAELEAAIGRLDNDSAGRVLHGMKGSAAYLDEPDLHHLCSELEKAADDERWGVIQGALPRLKRLLQAYMPVVDETD